MPQWIQDLTAGWPMIMANLPTFLVLVALIIGVVWWLMEWRYGGVVSNRDGVIANRDSEITLLKGQRDDYKDKLSGATPDQAKAHIERLEARLAAIEPRRLTPALRNALAASLQPPPSIQYSVSIASEIGGDSHQYAADFVSAFRQANWGINSQSSFLGGVRPPTGIAVSYLDEKNPTPDALALMAALRSVNVPFDIQHRGGPPETRVDLVIGSTFSS